MIGMGDQKYLPETTVECNTVFHALRGKRASGLEEVLDAVQHRSNPWLLPIPQVLPLAQPMGRNL